MTGMKFKLTKKEKLVIKRLKNLAKIWPKSLWLFSASGDLCIMKCGENNSHAMCGPNNDQGVDHDYYICSIDISNDGGDW